MKMLSLSLLAALCALPANAGTIAEFHRQCTSKGIDVVTVEDHGGGDIRLQFAPFVSPSDRAQAELDKTQFDFSTVDITKKEIDAAISTKAADDRVSDEEYAKLIRIQNIQDKTKRDAEWQKLKPALDTKEEAAEVSKP